MTDRAQTDSYYMCGRLWQTSLSFLFPSGKISQDLELGLHCLCPLQMLVWVGSPRSHTKGSWAQF